MRPTNQIGKTRIELAKILSDHFGVHVAPALLRQNYSDYRSGRNWGWAFSWYYDTLDHNHPLYEVGSGETMNDFIGYCKKGYGIELLRGELFICRPDKEEE